MSTPPALTVEAKPALSGLTHLVQSAALRTELAGSQYPASPSAARWWTFHDRCGQPADLSHVGNKGTEPAREKYTGHGYPSFANLLRKY